MREKDKEKNIKYKSKSDSKIERLTKKISFAEIDIFEKKEFIHYCTYEAHPGTIGQNLLYSKGCLNGCPHYKRFISEEYALEQTTDLDFIKRGAPKKNNKTIKPKIPRKKKKRIPPTTR